MKVKYLLALGFLAAITPVQASITVIDPNYSTSVYYTHSTSDSVQSYDWDGSNDLYYTTTTSSFNFGGFYKSGVGSAVVAGSSDFASTSVVSIGNYVYFNTSDLTNQKIYNYNTTTNTPSGSPVSTTPNYGLYTNGSQLFITGSVGFGTNHIYYSNLDGSGDPSSDPAVDLGVTSGGSGPLAFDSDGNLYYAPGFSDPSIYKFSADDLANAIADPTGDPLSVTGNLWLDYSSVYGAYSGGTSMAFDEDGNLLVTLTNFVDPSLLVKFGVDDLSGAYNNNAATLLEDTGILGELRNHNGKVYVSSGNQVFNVVPEPSTYALLGLGLATLVYVARRRLARS